MRIFATLLLLGLASEGWAKEWVMACELDGIKDIRYYKLIDPLLGKSQVKQKIIGRCQDQCTPRENYSCELEVYKSAAKLNTKKTNVEWLEIKKPRPAGSTRKYLVEEAHLIDFEFRTRTYVRKVFAQRTNKEYRPAYMTYFAECRNN